jgi:phenazine biosynthesis protein phzE
MPTMTAGAVGGPVGEADLDAVLGRRPPPFALLHRPGSTGGDRFELIVGEVRTVDRLADLPVPELSAGIPARHDLLVLVPYRQLAERGFACRDDGTPLLAIEVRAQGAVPVSELARRVPDLPLRLPDGRFDLPDASYAALVRRVLLDEIGRGEGSNFVVKRSFVATVPDYSPLTGVAFFRRLIQAESGAYWTFLVYTGDRTLVGATPERQVSLSGGVAVMNPISGTYRYPPSGPTVDDLLRFLADQKETDELYMVVDEELKMMCRVCATGARVIGPRLREMARLAHTEYFLEGRSSLDVRAILRETMFAPTVTGSPLESACRVITRHEPRGRGYYGGVLALIGQDRGDRTLDTAILIRTADIDRGGRLEIGVGATLVRHSDATAEVAETRAKAAGLLAAAGAAGGSGARPAGPRRRLGAHPAVQRALAARNAGLARFWLQPDGARAAGRAPLAGRRLLVVDAEDTFTAMLAHQLRSLGPTVTVRRFDADYQPDEHQLVVIGPGPGDPRNRDHPKIAALWALTGRLLAAGIPFLAVCLGHQVLASVLGFELVRRAVPNQGVQQRIDFFGRPARVGFYNSFVARSEADQVDSPGVAGPVAVSRDPGSGEVYGLRGPGFGSMQFHAESLLTEDGPEILAEAVTWLLRAETGAR